jgi:rubrerythrin
MNHVQSASNGRADDRHARRTGWTGLALIAVVAVAGCEAPDSPSAIANPGVVAADTEAVDAAANVPAGARPVAASAGDAVSAPFDEPTLLALHEALADERRAIRLYAAIMERFGERRPFANIINAERNHERSVIVLLQQRGHPIPPDVPVELPAVPDSFRAACQLGVQAEIENIEMYDRLMAAITDPDAMRVMDRLRWASQERHLPAFRRHAGGPGGGA